MEDHFIYVQGQNQFQFRDRSSRRFGKSDDAGRGRRGHSETKRQSIDSANAKYCRYGVVSAREFLTDKERWAPSIQATLTFPRLRMHDLSTG
jgi:hypothetical protein